MNATLSKQRKITFYVWGGGDKKMYSRFYSSKTTGNVQGPGGLAVNYRLLLLGEFKAKMYNATRTDSSLWNHNEHHYYGMTAANSHQVKMNAFLFPFLFFEVFLDTFLGIYDILQTIFTNTVILVF